MKKLAFVLLVLAPTLLGCPPSDSTPRTPAHTHR